MKILDTKTLLSGKWTEYREKLYQDRNGQEKQWSYIARRQERRAVVVIPVTEVSGSLIMVRQYRLPMERYVLEFPAGLVDEGESPEETAVRELAEETGYSGRVQSVSPPLCTSPGLTSELVYAVRMVCGEEPVRPPAPEASELLTVVRGTPAEIAAMARTDDDIIPDSKVLFYLEGLLNGS